MNWKAALEAGLDPDRKKNPQGKVICDACEILGIEPEWAAEIGVYKGYTSRIIKDRFPHCNLVMIDPWIDQQLNAKMYRENGPVDWEDIYNAVLEEFSGRGCSIIRTDSCTAAYMMQPESFDFVFIDADHSYQAVKKDIHHWMPKVRDGGLLCGHDYSSRGANKGVMKAVDECIGQDNIVVGSRKTWIHKVER